MLLTLIIVSIILLIVGLLFTPIIICIDTDKSLYYVRLKGVFKICIEVDKVEVLRVRFQTFFKNFYFYPLRQKEFAKKKHKRKKSQKKRSISLTMVFRILKSFRVTKMFVDLDTSNCITNAKLYPLFALLNYKYGGFNINFDGRTQLLLYLENRPIRILTSIINYKN